MSIFYDILAMGFAVAAAIGIFAMLFAVPLAIFWFATRGVGYAWRLTKRTSGALRARGHARPTAPRPSSP